jgi:hypothetical protein
MLGYRTITNLFTARLSRQSVVVVLINSNSSEPAALVRDIAARPHVPITAALAILVLSGTHWSFYPEPGSCRSCCARMLHCVMARCHVEGNHAKSSRRQRSLSSGRERRCRSSALGILAQDNGRESATRYGVEPTATPFRADCRGLGYGPCVCS